MDRWEELDSLVLELKSANEEWSRSSEQLSGQLEAFKAITDQLDETLNAIGVIEALTALNERLFNGAARVHQARTYYGLSRAAALVWHAIEDPRPEMANAAPRGMYSIEVRLGPRYLLGVQKDAGGAGDERLSILIEGEKQLVATLPTTAQKFRAALLRAFAAPSCSGPPRETEGTEPHEPAAEPGAAASVQDESSGASAAQTVENSDALEEPIVAAAAAAPEATPERQAKPRRPRTRRGTAPAESDTATAAGSATAAGEVESGQTS
jgi:hypothetical protein